MSDPQPDLVSRDRTANLDALRGLVAAALLSAEPKELASLSKEYRAITAELSTLAPPERSTSDDLAARRKARRSATTAAPHPSAGDVDSGSGSS